MTSVSQSQKRSSGVKKCGLILAVAWIMCNVFAFGVVAVSAAEKADEQVRIGVLAKRGSERCLEQWGPTAEYLSRQIPDSPQPNRKGPGSGKSPGPAFR